MQQAGLGTKLEEAKRELEKLKITDQHLKNTEQELKEFREGVEVAKQEHARMKVREAKEACEEMWARGKMELSVRSSLPHHIDSDAEERRRIQTEQVEED